MAIDDGYERAEQSYLQALRSDARSDELALIAKAVADAAKHWETRSYREFFDLRDRQGAQSREVIEKEIDAEKAELLHELWSDIAVAHRAARNAGD